MMNFRQKSHALCATARVANIPSVVCNVWVGVMIHHHFTDSKVAWTLVTALIASGICLYISGNFLNDWMDRAWDLQHRPERALPRGLFTPELYLGLALMFAATGSLLAFSSNPMAGFAALGILFFIVIYTVWHKRSPWMVIPMGLCRGLLPMIGALGMITTDTNPATLGKITATASITGAALFFYIVGLSLSARGESKPEQSTRAKIPAFTCLLITALMIFPLARHLQISSGWWLAPVPYLLWLTACQTRFRRPIPRYVSALLAGIPLIDCITLIPLSLWMLHLATPSLPIISLVLPVFVMLAALTLQRLAPAT